MTGVTEDNIRAFAGQWTGTGTIENSGDNERLALDAGEYMIGEVVETGAVTVTLLQNVYQAGDTVTMKYRTGATYDDCVAAAWIAYSVPFMSDGFAQVRMESTL